MFNPEELNEEDQRKIKEVQRLLGKRQFTQFARVISKKPNLEVALMIGNESFTDHKKIVVSLSKEEILKYSLVELYDIILFKLAHECQHNLSTHPESFKAAIDRMVAIWEDLAEAEGLTPASSFLMQVAHFVVNSIEDGRIERIMIYHNRGLRKRQLWYRYQCWEEAPAGMVEEKQFFTVLLNQILSISTLGIFQKDFISTYATVPELIKAAKNCIVFIQEGNSARLCAGLVRPCGELAKILFPWLKVVMQEAAAREEFMKQMEKIMKDLLESMAGEEENFMFDPTSEEQENDSKGMSSPLRDIIGQLQEQLGEKAEEATAGEELSSSAERESGSLADSISEAVKKAVKNVVEKVKEDCAAEYHKVMASEDAPKRVPRELKKKKEEKESEDSSIMPEDLDKIQESYVRDTGRIPFRIRDNKEYRVRSQDNPECRAIGRRLNRLLTQIFATKQSLDVRNQHKGLLDPRNLRKLTYGGTDLFVRRGTPYEPDVVCYILKDGSGSMRSYDKNKRCCEALGGIEQAMKNLIPLKIVDFSEDSYTPCVRHTVVKDWNETNQEFNYSWNYYQNGGGEDGNNCDGFSIRVATRELLMRSEEHKLLIVMSDGMPASEFYQHDFGLEDVRNAVNEARAAGIYVVSIFFGNEEFLEYEKEVYRQMYEKDFFGATPENLVSELSRHLKKFIKAY